MNQIVFGDCRDTMRQWKRDGVKVQMCVTSPPYFGLRDYGHDEQIGLEETPEQYIDAMVEVFRCVKNVLADDGVLWLNLGDSYYNYRPGKGQALVKQSVSNTNQDLPQNCARRGNKLEGLKEKDLIGIPWMLAFALRADGWYLRQDIIWNKPNPMPESVTDRCTKAHEYIFLLSKSPKYFYDNEAIKEPITDSTALRLLQDVDNQKGSDRVPGKTNGNMKAVGRKKFDSSMGGGGTSFVGHSGYKRADGTVMVNETRNKRSVWTVNTKPYKGAHFAVFPEELIEPCILAGSRAGDVVFDPFMGSGTTAQVAQKLGRKYLGCELNTEYKSLQDKRIAQQSLELI